VVLCEFAISNVILMQIKKEFVRHKERPIFVFIVFRKRPITIQKVSSLARSLFDYTFIIRCSDIVYCVLITDL